MPRPWEQLLSPEDREVVRRAGFGGRVGFGERLAVLVVDVQNYMVGPPPGSSHEYPSACGSAAAAALVKLAELLAAARAAGAPVFYTRYEFRRDGGDTGVYGAKRGVPRTEGWALEGSEGAEIAAAVAPAAVDTVLVKKKPSAFFGTPLVSMLIDRGVDTVAVCGGSTSNCVRATAVDAMSYNFHTLVPADCVFDRLDISHRVALFDLDRQYADVLDSERVIAWIRSRGA